MLKNCLAMRYGPIALSIVSIWTVMAGRLVADDGIPLLSTASVSVSSESKSVPAVDHIQGAFLRRSVGTIESLDVTNFKLMLRERQGVAMDFTLTKRTRATSDGKRIRLSGLKIGDKVMVQYVDGTSFVRKIILLTAPERN